MDNKAFEEKMNRDIDKTKADIATLGEDATTLEKDGATGLGRKFNQMTNDTKQMVAVRVKSINQEVGNGLSQYNAKVQEFADRVPGDLGKKAAKFPWVTITMSLAFGLILGVLLKPGRQPVG